MSPFEKNCRNGRGFLCPDESQTVYNLEILRTHCQLPNVSNSHCSYFVRRVLQTGQHCIVTFFLKFEFGFDHPWNHDNKILGFDTNDVSHAVSRFAVLVHNNHYLVTAFFFFQIFPQLSSWTLWEGTSYCLLIRLFTKSICRIFYTAKSTCDHHRSGCWRTRFMWCQDPTFIQKTLILKSAKMLWRCDDTICGSHPRRPLPDIPTKSNLFPVSCCESGGNCVRSKPQIWIDPLSLQQVSCFNWTLYWTVELKDSISLFYSSGLILSRGRSLLICYQSIQTP